MGEDRGPSPALSRLRPWYLALVLGLAAVVPFMPGVNSPFMFDDIPNIKENPAILSFDPGCFFTDPAAFSAKPGNWPYRPLTVTVNSVLRLAGADTAFSWHVLALVLHMANTLLVLLVARRGFRLGRSAFVPAFIFALAPLQTQAVLYASALGVVLSLFFAMLAVWSMVCMADREGKGGRFAPLVVLCAAAAFFSYEGALALCVWLPLVIVCGDRSLFQKRTIAVLAAVLFFAFLYIAARMWFSAGGLLSGHQQVRPEYSLFEQVITGLQLPWIMAALLVFPRGLNFFHHPCPPGEFFTVSAILTISATAVLFAELIRLRSCRVPVGGVAWYLAALLPAALVSLNLPWSEHRSYLALPGISITAGYAAWKLGTGVAVRRSLKTAFLVLAALFLAINTAKRARTWTSEEEMMKDAIQKSPRYYVPLHLLADHYRKQGECEKALPLSKRAVHLNPEFADAHNTMAHCLLKEGRTDEAKRAAQRAHNLDRDNPMYKRNLAVSLIAEGELKRAKSLLVELIESLPRHHYVRRLAERDLRRIRD